MRRMSSFSGSVWVIVLAIATELWFAAWCRAAVTREEVERAIREGVRYLKTAQRDDV